MRKLTSKFCVINACACPRDIGTFIAICLQDAGAHANSIYRGQDPAGVAILHKYGKSSQADLYRLFQQGRGLPANRPGTSTHEKKSDGHAYPQYGVGTNLPWWCQGFDVDDVKVPAMKAAAAKHGWTLFQPYPSGSEYHHLNFKTAPAKPKPSNAKAWARFWKTRWTLPSS